MRSLTPVTAERGKKKGKRKRGKKKKKTDNEWQISHLDARLKHNMMKKHSTYLKTFPIRDLIPSE